MRLVNRDVAATGIRRPCQLRVHDDDGVNWSINAWAPTPVTTRTPPPGGAQVTAAMPSRQSANGKAANQAAPGRSRTLVQERRQDRSRYRPRAWLVRMAGSLMPTRVQGLAG
jgi:hypothetical protein